MDQVPWAMVQRMLIDAPGVDSNEAESSEASADKKVKALPDTLTPDNANDVMDTLNSLFQ